MMTTRSRALSALMLTAALAACGDNAETSSGDGYGGAPASAPEASSLPTEYGSSAAPDTNETAVAPASAAGGAAVQLAESPLGKILTDSEGYTLYLFTKDGDGGVPTCEGGCAAAWPAAIADGEIVAGDGIDPSLVTTVDTPSGPQLKVGKWPLYRYASDAAPGETAGQGSGGVWYAVGADGKPIK
jgi:predicted lipoprotein with Yx(FWY)xxD motif